MPSLAKNKSKSLKPKKVALKNGHKNGHKNGIKVSAKTAILKKAGKVAKRTFFFGGGKAEGTRDMKDLLGGKGANLAEMANIGLPVPPGFTISTEGCLAYLKEGRFPDGLMDEAGEHLDRLEKAMKKKLGDPGDPLLVSVRSGAKFSMPGMMDTVLNLGLNDESVLGLAKQTSDERFAYDSYRRFISMYGRIVLAIHAREFDDPFEAAKERTNSASDADIPSDALADLCEVYK